MRLKIETIDDSALGVGLIGTRMHVYRREQRLLLEQVAQDEAVKDLRLLERELVLLFL